MIKVEDHIEITQIINLYGHLIDNREWSRMGEVFVEDLVFDTADFGGGQTKGLAALVEGFSSEKANHPLAHHATNIIVWQDPDGTVRAQSKGYGPRPDPNDNRTTTYKDVLRHTPEGWRIAERSVYLMRPRPNN